MTDFHSYPIIDVILWKDKPTATVVGHCDEGCHTEWVSAADENLPKVGEWLTVISPKIGAPYAITTTSKPKERLGWVEIFLSKRYYKDGDI